MEGISMASAAGNGIPLQFQAEFQAKVASLQKNALQMQGDLILQLIQSAADASVGGNVDLRV